MSSSTASRRSSAFSRHRGHGRGRGRGRGRVEVGRNLSQRRPSRRSSPNTGSSTSRRPSVILVRNETGSPIPSRRRVDRSVSSNPYTDDAYQTSEFLASSDFRNARGAPKTSNNSGGATADEEAELNVDLDTFHETIVAIDMKGRGEVGCCYYLAREETLYFMEDVKVGGGDIIDGLKATIEPTTVLVPVRAEETLLDRLDPDKRVRESTVTSSSERDEFALPYRLEIRPSAEFAYEGAKNKLVNLQLDNGEAPKVTFVVPGDIAAADSHVEDPKEETGKQGLLLKLAGWINIESRIAVGCAGAVLSYLQRRRAARFLPGDRAQDSLLRVTTVAMFSLKDTMFINSDTLDSLQIIQSEAHPHLHNQGPKSSGSKEGLSIYGLFHSSAHTPQGRLLLRQWFLRPSLNLTVINERLDAVATFLRPSNQVQTDELIKNLAHVKNARSTLISLRKGVCNGTFKGGIKRSVWVSLREFIYRVLKMSDISQEVHGSDRIPICRKVRDTFDQGVLQQVGRALVEVIDYEASEEECRTVVNQGIDSELDGMKRVWAGTESMLAEVARHISNQVPSFLDVELNVVLFPQIGFLIAIPLDPESGSGVWEGTTESPWEKMFNSDKTAYYKSSEMSELDQKFGDIHSIICDKEIEIIHQLAQDLLQYEGLLGGCSDVCAELDCLLALALGARHYNYTRPTVTTQNVVDIKSGRHPLQELTVSAYVANDTCLAASHGNEVQSEGSQTSEIPTFDCATAAMRESSPNVLLLTGPNYSGKSVYLKQVAIIVYMAHIGSFVPAEAARIGLTDKILTRISTRESVSKTQSAFMIDLQQVSVALSLATPRSLLVIDEFGKGTEACDGAGLACGLFRYLLDLEERCPKVLGATHYHEIFEAGFLQSTPRLSFGNMEIRTATDPEQVEDQITYLYNFREGRSISSFGTCCAAINGIAGEIIDRAEQLILLAARGENLVETCAVMPAHEEAELEEAELIAREFISMNETNFAHPAKVLQDLLSASLTNTTSESTFTKPEMMIETR